MRRFLALSILLVACRPSPPAESSRGTTVQAAVNPIDRCHADSDCRLLKEDGCCMPTLCDEDQRAETPARTEARHRACAVKDCAPAKRAECSAADSLFVPRCRDERCVVELGR